MKKLLAFVIICLILTACAPQLDTTPEVFEATPETTPTEAEVPSPRITLFIPNDQNNGFVKEEVDADRLTETFILKKLIEYGALPEDVEINSFEYDRENQVICIELNEALSNHLIAVGKASQDLLIASIAYTFTNAYNARSIVLTADGEVIKSGEMAFVFPLAEKS